MKPLAMIMPMAAVLIAVGAAFAGGRNTCTVPMAEWQPREMVAALAAEMGWQVRRIKIDDGCYAVVGRDKDGRQIEAYVHPANLTVIGIEYEDDEHEEGHDRAESDPH